MSSSKKLDFNQVMGFFAFVAILFIGISLLITNIADKASIALIKSIATYAMYVVLGVLSFYYCSTKNNPIWFGVWGVAVVILIVANVI